MGDGFEAHILSDTKIQAKATKQGTFKVNRRPQQEMTFEIYCEEDHSEKGDLNVCIATTKDGPTKVTFTATRNGVYTISMDDNLEVSLEVRLEDGDAAAAAAPTKNDEENVFTTSVEESGDYSDKKTCLVHHGT